MRAADLAVITVPTDDDIPAVTSADLLGGQSVLVLAPHPDDESLACGGLLAAAFQRSVPRAHVVCLTDGAASHPASKTMKSAELAALRRQELCAAVTHLGGAKSDVTWIGAPDGDLTVSEPILAAILNLARAAGSGLLLAPSPLDPHCDHLAGAEIGRQIARRLPAFRLCFYPVWSRWHGGGTAPVPEGTHAVRVPTAAYRPMKSAAIAAHRSQQGLLIDDDPDGFEMPPGFASFFTERDELFFMSDQGGQP